MKKILQYIAARLATRIKEYNTFPRTQTTDAMKGFGNDLLLILEDAIATIDDGDDVNLEELISTIVTNQLDSLTAPPPAPPKKKSKSKTK